MEARVIVKYTTSLDKANLHWVLVYQTVVSSSSNVEAHEVGHYCHVDGSLGRHVCLFLDKVREYFEDHYEDQAVIDDKVLLGDF